MDLRSASIALEAAGGKIRAECTELGSIKGQPKALPALLERRFTAAHTARQLDAEPTGNARAFAFGDEPLVRMRNTAIMPGPDRLGDMIAAVDRGYYLKRVSNGQADWTSEFMFRDHLRLRDSQRQARPRDPRHDGLGDRL